MALETDYSAQFDVPSAQRRDPRRFSGDSPTDSPRKFYCYGLLRRCDLRASGERARTGAPHPPEGQTLGRSRRVAPGPRATRSRAPHRASGDRKVRAPGPASGPARAGGPAIWSPRPAGSPSTRSSDHPQVLARQHSCRPLSRSVVTVKESIFGSRTRRASENGGDLPSRLWSTTASSEQPAGNSELSKARKS